MSIVKGIGLEWSDLTAAGLVSGTRPFPLSLRNVEDLLHERGIDVCHESVRLWVDRFGPIFAGKIQVRRASCMRQLIQWQWHLDEAPAGAFSTFI